MHKKYDLTVKIGEYTTRDGQTKAKWHNVGAVMEKDDGSRFILLDRHFNPAGVPNPENRGNVLLSMFAPRDNQGQQSPPPAPASDPDDVPF